MTVYIHFKDTTRAPVKRHNVLAVVDDGDNAIKLRLYFIDETPSFTGVSHVAIQPERAE